MTWKGRKVLVTGGAGFIGSRLVEELVRRRASVTAADLCKPSEAKRLEGVASKINILKCDVSEKKDLRKLDKKYDYIFHMAALAYPKYCEENPKLAFKNNISGAFNIVNLAKNMKVKKIVFPSSAQLYGRYPRYFPIDERHPVEYENSVYNFTKKYGEDILLLYGEKYNLPYVFFRLFNIFGPRQDRIYFLPTLITQALEKNVVELWSPKPTRDFTFVDDAINAFIRAAESKFVGGPINIGSNIELRVGDIAEKIADYLDVKIRFLNRDVSGSMRMRCNNERAFEILHWKPKIQFENGLDRTLKWYEKKSL